VGGVEGSVTSAVDSHTGEDEEEGVCYECGRGFGKAEWFFEGFGED